ncbi:MAG: amino acid ABC transporter permease [Anaerolineales bacterium]|uniref:Amino acid ABC transporter permease n=1 Tax=Candidatus Desulfolinea nitratireducens TaxID=2841698 RepID=A0A8J6NHW5_9CHLR|nr:amino acid ABC transporter permease [Candidatus Desulfolinea nitratireducens]MBL6959976.1 amino acid ABC transporter permease [Anaerolineales bacterium]
MTESITQIQEPVGKRFNWEIFLQDNITGSWFQAIWVLLLTIFTISYAISQFDNLPLSTGIILGGWVIGIFMVVRGELSLKHSRLSRWLKNNLISSISNTILTLLIILVIAFSINSIWQWAVVNANFNPLETTPEFRTEEGATWGVIFGARKLLMTGLMAPEDSWRVWIALGFILVMWVLTLVSGRPKLKEKLKALRTVVNTVWLLSPAILYLFLAGAPNNPYNIKLMLIAEVGILAIYLLLWWQKVVQFYWRSFIITALGWPLLYTIWSTIGTSEFFPPINVDTWGGLLLTMIIASAVIVLSLPLGMVLALGRRSEVYGIPDWIVWPVAVGAMIWGFTTTPVLLETSRNLIERLLAFWPLLIFGVAYILQRAFKGNVVAGASTTFIEFIRSVPLITLLFMGIVMAPFFLAPGVYTPKPWPVIIGYTLFASAYSAEIIRGGLQAIPHGQFEAADSLGFNGLQKMRFIVLPQALRIVIPPIVGQFIGAFKSSSLVSIVGLFDFVGISKVVIANNEWLGLRTELYVFMAVVYFLGSFLMSSYSRRLEVRLGLGER